MRASLKDEKEMYRYDPQLGLIDLNRQVKFKTPEWLDKEYDVLMQNVKRMRLMNIIEFKQGPQNIQRVMHPSAIEDTVRYAIQTVSCQPVKK